MNIEIQVFENIIVPWWEMTNNKKGCRFIVENINQFAEAMPDCPEVVEAVTFLRDIAFMKGQFMQLRENYKAWAGE